MRSAARSRSMARVGSCMAGAGAGVMGMTRVGTLA